MNKGSRTEGLPKEVERPLKEAAPSNGIGVLGGGINSAAGPSERVSSRLSLLHAVSANAMVLVLQSTPSSIAALPDSTQLPRPPTPA